MPSIARTKADESFNDTVPESGVWDMRPAYKMLAEFDGDGRRNRFALLAWYAERHDGCRLPHLDDLLEFLTMPTPALHTRLEELGDLGPDGTRQVEGWRWLLTEMRAFWPDPEAAPGAEAGLQAAPKDGT